MKLRKLHFLLPIFALAIFPVIGKTLDDIRRAFTRDLPTKFANLSEWSQPQGGEELALPGEVLNALKLLRQTGAKSFAYSPRFQAGFEQRLLEAAYPIKPDPGSTWRLQFANEESRGCTIKLEAEGVQVVECP